MKRFLALVAILLFAQSCFALVSVSPSSFSFQLAPNESATRNVSIMSIDSNTTSYLVTWDGPSEISVFWDKGFLEFSGIGDSETIALTVEALNDTGVFEGNLVLQKIDSTESKQIPVKVSVVKWLSEDTIWVKEDEALSINNTYELEVDSVSNYVTYDFYKNGSKMVNQSRLSEGEDLEMADLLLTVLQIDSDSREAKFRIQSTAENQTWSIEEREGDYGIGKLEPTVSKYIMTLAQGKETEVTIGIRNEFNDAVELQDVLLFPLGGSLFAIKEAQLKTLPPQEKATVTIKIDSKGVDTGTYSANLTVVGYYKQQKVSTEITIDLSITPGATPVADGASVEEIACIIPGNAFKNRPFEVAVENVLDSDSIKIKNQTNLALKSQTYANKKETFSLSYSSTGSLPIIITVTRDGAILKECSSEVNVQEYSFEIELSDDADSLQSGDDLEIYLVDANGENIDGEILVNGEKYEGEFDVEVGDHAIKATVFDVTKTLDFSVEQKVVYAPQQYYTTLTNTPLEIRLNDSTDWEIRDIKGQVVQDGDSKKVSFTPTLAGRYVLYNANEDSLLTTIDAQAEGIPYWMPLVLVIAIVAVIVVVKFFPNKLKKLKGKKKEEEGTKFMEETDVPSY